MALVWIAIAAVSVFGVFNLSRLLLPRRGDGTAWLVADCQSGGFFCYWYTGIAGDRLGEQTHVASAREAVAWGRWRTPLVRIRTADARTSWAGTAPPPDGIADTWTDRDPPIVATPTGVPASGRPS